MNKINYYLGKTNEIPKMQFAMMLMLVFLGYITYSVVSETDTDKIKSVIEDRNQWRFEIINQAQADKIIDNNNLKKAKQQVILLSSLVERTDKCITINKNNDGTLKEPIKCSEIKTSKELDLIAKDKEKKQIPHKLVIQWMFNPNWEQRYIELVWKTVLERATSLLDKFNFDYRFWLTNWEWINKFKRAWDRHWIEYPVLICIAKADSSLGRELKSKNNIWNVWNNDRWDTVEYSDIGVWIDAMWKVLNNKNLKYKQTIWSLSLWGWGSAPFYATSPKNWNINVLNCLKLLYNEPVNENFNIRTK